MAFFNLKYIATTAFHRLLDIIFHTILDFLTKDCYLKQVSKLKTSNEVHFKTFLLIRPKNTKPFNKGRYTANFAPLIIDTNAEVWSPFWQSHETQLGEKQMKSTLHWPLGKYFFFTRIDILCVNSFFLFTRYSFLSENLNNMSCRVVAFGKGKVGGLIIKFY